MSEYKFRIGNEVEVVANDQRFSGVHGRVTAIRNSGDVYVVHFPQFMATQGFGADDLELTDTKAANLDEPDMVRHPNHYSAGTPDGIEVIDILRAHEAAGGTWETMNALKYILRFPFKGNAAQDLAKAEQYLSMWRDREVSA